MSRSESSQTGTAAIPSITASQRRPIYFTAGMTQGIAPYPFLSNAIEYMQWDAVEKLPVP